MTQNPFSFNYITLLQTSTYQSKKIDIKNAGFMRPAITFLNIQLSNSREKRPDAIRSFIEAGGVSEKNMHIMQKILWNFLEK